MASPGIKENHSGLSNIGDGKEGIVKYYDDWTESYDRTLDKWDYEAPRKAASVLRDRINTDSLVIDAGCGTGMTGAALKAAGFGNIEGMDFSPQSLKVAENQNCYRKLANIDMQKQPLPIESDRYGGLLCVGVLTYLPGLESIIKEFCRIVKSGGTAVVTQRNDIFSERGDEKVLTKLLNDGFIGNLNISAPMP